MLTKHAVNGNADEASEALSPKTREYFRRDPDAPYFMAALMAKAGAFDESIEWFELCVERGWQNYPLFAEGDVILSGIRNDPRFKKILERIKQKWESFEP